MNRTLFIILCAVLSTLLFIQSPSYAQLTFNESNGHWYELIDLGTQPPLNWDDAKTFAAGRSHLGVPGHLATITSSSENQFLLNNYFSYVPQGSVNVWIGGHQLNNQSATNVGWYWITGEPWSFTYWDPGEPNDCCGTPDVEDNEENCLEYLFDTDSQLWGWNDRWCGNLTSLLLVEYDGGSPPVGAPTMTEWGMIILVLLLGAGSLYYLRRRNVAV